MPGQKSMLDFVNRLSVKRPLQQNSESSLKKFKSDSQNFHSSDDKCVSAKNVNNCENSKPCNDNLLLNIDEKIEFPDSAKLCSQVGEENVKPLEGKKVIWPNEIIAKIKLASKRCPTVHPSIGHSWFKALEAEFKKPYFVQLNQFLLQERERSRVFPPEDKVWTWTHLCSVSDVKVVILGQDPYHNPGQAQGLCFSVPKGVTPPPSLLNMYRELETDIPGFTRPNHGNLTGWAEQGVLLLNACLTVRSNSPNSHKDCGWEQLTDAVMKHLSIHRKGIVFLLWGSYAQKKAAVVDQKKHHLLKSTHPSPLSAHRGFLGCRHFSQCNELLRSAGKEPIDWSHL